MADNVKAAFTRATTAALGENAEVPEGWFVISHRWIPETGDRRRAHGRWFRIRSAHCAVFRVLRFSPNLKGSPAQGGGDIVIDWGAWLDLHDRVEDVGQPIELEVSPARWWHWPKLAVSHPDPSMRLAGYLALVSLALGIISLIVSFK